MSPPFDPGRWAAILAPLQQLAESRSTQAPPPPEIDPLRFPVDVRWGIVVVVAILIAVGLWYAGNRR